jgi:hypothetical protein
VLPDRSGISVYCGEQENKMNEIKCERIDHFKSTQCDKPATYTLRIVSGGRIYHFCKEHYQEVKVMLDENDE